jgi:hypothetical protein
MRETLYIIELTILASVDGVVQLRAMPTGAATQVTIRQGSFGFLDDAP